jgi:hypothetical protein
VRFEVLMAANMKMAVFWVVTPCSLVEVCEVSEVLTATTQKAAIFILAAVRTSYLTRQRLTYN